MKLSNFKEARITQNEDNTYKAEFCGVQFKDIDGTELEARIIYPRVKISTNDVSSDNKQFYMDIFPDNNKNKYLYSIHIPEEE